MTRSCEYFTRYGNEGVPGSCGQPATLDLVDSDVTPTIVVCYEHALRIVERFPTLGGLTERFVRMPRS
jgi:hypothetical protein